MTKDNISLRSITYLLLQHNVIYLTFPKSAPSTPFLRSPTRARVTWSGSIRGTGAAFRYPLTKIGNLSVRRAAPPPFGFGFGRRRRRVSWFA